MPRVEPLLIFHFACLVISMLRIYYSGQDQFCQTWLANLKENWQNSDLMLKSDESLMFNSQGRLCHLLNIVLLNYEPVHKN